ncbi:MAG: circadian clock protein KaiC [Candidatus Obscuribacterales bacterium]
MTNNQTSLQSKSGKSVKKCPSGIPGLDQITGGGLPRGRTSLVCGSSGSGKTLFAMEFLINGATTHGDAGVFISFEEDTKELIENVGSLGFEIEQLIADKKISIIQIRVERAELEETGNYDLDGLFIRLGHAIDSIGAKRVAIDTIETLFSALNNERILRSEIGRLFRWLKDKNVTAIVTAERGANTLTRHGLEEYASDCVFLLDQRVQNQIATRHLRIIKYRGSSHGTNEYPFLLNEHGFSVVPITAVSLNYKVSSDLVSTGITQLDELLGGKGYYRGGTIMVSGSTGTGKTSVAAHLIDAACRRGERALFFAFEESPDQFLRNMLSIGIDLKIWADKGLLLFKAVRPTNYGLDTHLASIRYTLDDFQPSVVVLDPVSSFELSGNSAESGAMLMCLVDLIKSRQITSLFTCISKGEGTFEQTELGITSLIDCWISLRNLEQAGERTRALYVLKARGMAHSNNVREFVITNHGVELLDVYVGPNGILTGSAKANQQLKDKLAELASNQDCERRRAMITLKRQAMEAKIAEIQAQFEVERKETEAFLESVEILGKAQESIRSPNKYEM